MWGKATARPIDFAAILLGTAMSAVIVINALYLQTGSRSAPYFTPPVATSAPAGTPLGAAQASAQISGQATGTTAAKPAEQIIATRPVAGGAIAAQPVSVRRDDPIADLIAPQPSPKVTAVQRALSEYGYGQIKPTGIVDEATGAAIQKFEREHKLPVTGRVSDKLVSQLTALVGHPLN
jgi:peptidoglycan hydrolase-like protein with peptidoglycan-binding domain